jgi:hypothetical protein
LLLERPGVDVRDSAYDIVLYDWNDYSSMAIAYNFINAKLKHLQALNIYIYIYIIRSGRLSEKHKRSTEFVSDCVSFLCPFYFSRHTAFA